MIRPSRWFWLGIAGFWSFRALALRAAHDFSEPIPRGAFVAFGWDLVLGLGLFALARLLVHPETAARPRVHLATRYAGFLVFILADSFMRAADLLYCTLTGRHFSAGAFIYISPANLALLADGHNPLAGCALLAAAAACMSALVLDGRAYRARPGAPRPFSARTTHALAIAALVVTALPVGSGFAAPEHQSASFVPESAFLRQWLVYRGLLAAPDAPRLALPEGLDQRLRALGLSPQRALDPRYPLLRAQLDPTPFPYPSIPSRSAGPPNVVLTLVEQLNHEFVDAFSGELPGLMPELSSLARELTMVTEYQSVTQPTIHALVAVLCSMHGALPYDDINPGLTGSALETTRVLCLPEILRAHGYHTVYIQAGSNRFAGTARFLSAHGFDEIIGADELEPIFAGRGLSTWGVHDDALVEFTEQKIRELEAQRERGGPPFFVMAQTLDMHAPGHPPRDCALPDALGAIASDADSRMMLRAVHCTDRALGALGRFILGNETRRARTLWALTGDHPTEPLAFLQALHARRDRTYAGWSGRLPLVLHDPTHALPARVPVLSGHLDLAPTLLHILGMVDVVNAMEGYSIFGQRPEHRVLLGRMAPESVAIYRPGRTRSLSVEALVELCREHAPLVAGDDGALSSCDLLDWLRWQNALWKYQRIFPAVGERDALIPAPSTASLR